MRQRVAFIVCVLLHAYVLWNVYQADKLTPRIIRATLCVRHHVTGTIQL